MIYKKVASLPQLSCYDIVVNGVSTTQKVPFISYGGRRYVHFDSMLKTFLNVGDTGYIFNDQAKRIEIGAFVKNKNGVWLSDLEYFIGEYKVELYDHPIPVSIDLTGVNYFTIEFENLIYARHIPVVCDPLLIP